MGKNKNNNMRKRKRQSKEQQKHTIHPRNKYADNPPDFALLASLYPSFHPYVFYSPDGRPKIDWTDFKATRELTRVLLLHDHSIHWWIPDGQLCPTVPNRSNYIHWIEDLLSSDIIEKDKTNGDTVRGFDIGTGANCIYPLLGASLLGWHFVGSDMTDVAIEWANKNIVKNPHISQLIEIRKVDTDVNALSLDHSCDDAGKTYHGPSVLVGVVKEGENFDFCMCNPPFFESMEEAGLNPKTACGGTSQEMVCHGGEKAFIMRIIEDSIILKQSFRWYTSMVGRKLNLKFLISKLWEVGVTVVKTTEFVQGHTCRWGLAWSFMPPTKNMAPSQVVPQKSSLSFILEGIQRRYSAIHVLQSVESLYHAAGACCKLNTSNFTADINMSSEQCETILKSALDYLVESTSSQNLSNRPYDSISLISSSDGISFRISVFQQIPGTLLVKGSLQQKDGPNSGAFASLLQQLEDFLKTKLCR